MAEKLKIYSEFEDLVRQILEAHGISIRHDRFPGCDFFGRVGDKTLAIEVKYYHTAIPQIKLLHAAATRLLSAMNESPDAGGILIVSCYIEPRLRKNLEKKYGIIFVDRVELEHWVRDVPPLLDRLNSFLETSGTLPQRWKARTVTEAIKYRLRPTTPPKPEFTGTELCSRLQDLKCGEDWQKYESLCEEILKYLFNDDLQVWEKQSSTDDDLSRYDLICRVRSRNEFWRFLIEQLSSQYVVFEFKNYCDEIKQGQILTTEKYLFEKALRRVGIILTRKGADDNAIAMAKGAMREHGKLILVLNDDDICSLLHSKEKGDDPSDMLFHYADRFLITLAR